MAKQKVLITGSEGRIGAFLLNDLKDKEYSLFALSYGGALKSGNQDINYFKGDLLNPESYVPALKGVSTVIHAAGITHTNNIRRYYRVNSFGTLELLRRCKAYGVKRFIFLSTRAISYEGGHYSRSKHIAEKYVQESGLDWIILRFGEIYGTRSNKGIDALIGQIERFPFIPVVGNGKYTLMPLYISDAVSSIVKVLENEGLNKRVYTIAGPEAMSYNELIDRILALKMRNKIKIHIPLSVARALSTITALVTADAFLAKDQLLRLICEKNNDISLARKELDFIPRKMEDTPLVNSFVTT